MNTAVSQDIFFHVYEGLVLNSLRQDSMVLSRVW